MLRITDTPFRSERELAAFRDSVGNAGAIVSFTGLVRDIAGSDTVTALCLQAYSPMTENGIKTAMQSARETWSLTSLMVIHRVGEIGPGEDIVFVAAASEHRRDAFLAADFLMDYLKTEAIFWKKEKSTAGETWIEPRAADYDDRARWNQDLAE